MAHTALFIGYIMVIRLGVLIHLCTQALGIITVLLDISLCRNSRCQSSEVIIGIFRQSLPVCLAQPVSVAIISIFVVTYYAAAPQSCSDSGQVLIQVISIIRNEICSYPQTLYITICSYQRWQLQKSLVNIRKWHRYQALQSIYTVCSG